MTSTHNGKYGMRIYHNFDEEEFFEAFLEMWHEHWEVENATSSL